MKRYSIARIFTALTFLLSLVLLFQNCSGGFNSSKNSDAASVSSSVPSPTPAPSPAPIAGAFTPLFQDSFSNLPVGQTVAGASYTNGYGAITTQSIHRPGHTSSLAISIKQGSDGDPAGGDTGTGMGGFGVDVGFDSNQVTEGQSIWIGLWIYFPSTFNVLTNDGYLKFLRVCNSATAQKTDVEIFNNGTTSQQGWLHNDENDTSGFLSFGSKNILPRDQWTWVELQMTASANKSTSVRRFWANGKFTFEINGNAVKYIDTNGTLQTTTLASGGVATLPAAGASLNELMLFTYWNGYAPQSQTVYVSDIVYHKNAATLPAVDTYGNKMMGPSAIP